MAEQTTASGTMQTAATTITTQTTQTPPQSSTGGSAGGSASWIDTLNADHKAFVTEQGFKEPAEVLEQYRNLIKLRGVGADKLLRTPDSFTDAKEQEQAWNQIFDRLGRPKTAAEYGIENKEDAENTKFLTETFHKAGLTKKQAEDLYKTFTERSTTLGKTALENQQLLAKQQVDGLKREWGSGYEQNMRLARQGQQTLGLDDKAVDQIAAAIGIDKTLRFLNETGRRVGEGTFIQGTKGTETHTPDTAAAKIKTLMSDRSFTDRLMAGDAQAKAQWTALHEQMGAGANYA